MLDIADFPDETTRLDEREQRTKIADRPDIAPHTPDRQIPGATMSAPDMELPEGGAHRRVMKSCRQIGDRRALKILFRKASDPAEAATVRHAAEQVLMMRGLH